MIARLVLLLLFPLTAFGQSAAGTFFWLPNKPSDAVTGYRVYEVTQTTRTFLTATPGTETTITLGAGNHSIALTAVNARNMESDLSPSLLVSVVKIRGRYKVVLK